MAEGPVNFIRKIAGVSKDYQAQASVRCMRRLANVEAIIARRDLTAMGAWTAILG